MVLRQVSCRYVIWTQCSKFYCSFQLLERTSVLRKIIVIIVFIIIIYNNYMYRAPNSMLSFKPHHNSMKHLNAWQREDTQYNWLIKWTDEHFHSRYYLHLQMRKVRLRLLPRSHIYDNLKSDQSASRIYTFSTISHSTALPIIKE